MQRTVIAVTLVALLPGLIMSYPGIGGGRGLFRVQNALVEDEAGLTISLNAIGRNPVIRRLESADEKAWVADLIMPEISYAPVSTQWVGAELFGSWGGIAQFRPDAPDGKFFWGNHDLRVGGKLSIPIIPVLKLGGMASYRFADRDTHNTVLPRAIPFDQDEKLSWSILATVQFQDLMPSLPNLMVNYTEDENAKTYGAGVELAAEGFALFTEVQSVQPDATWNGIFDTDHGGVRLTPGIAFGTGTEGMTLKAGYTFGFGQDSNQDIDNELMVGLVIATPFGKRAPVQRGVVAGRVIDDRTGAGIAARVSFPEHPRLAPLTSSAAGVFTIERVPAGVVVVEVEAEGYQGQAVPVNVPANATAQYEFRLRPLVTYGTIAGLVTDVGSNRPLAASIEFPGTDLTPVQSDPATGAFRVDDVPAGIYTATASADGYFKGSLTVQVEEGAVAAPNFALRVLADRSTFTGKVSDKQSGAALKAEISFPDAEVGMVMSDGATGVFMAEIPVGSYAVKVSADGYIDQTAAIVIQKDQPLVKNFELVKEGMTITLRGVYFDVNKAIVKPESRPALEDAAKILQDNPGIRVEIQGHTDSDGPAAHNQTLSERRAQSVVNYLIQNFGIDRGRLVARGYGEDQPIATNATPEGKALNRRVEFVILGQ